MGWFPTQLIEWNSYETRQSFLEVFVRFFGFDHAKKHNSCLFRTEELTNGNVLVL